MKGIIKNIFAAAACVSLTASAWAQTQSKAQATHDQSQTPKYIFYCIGDGMGLAPVMAADLYARQFLGQEDGLAVNSWPVRTFISTYSASSDVTDSAAAGTALATGHKTINGMLGVTPDSAAVVSVAERLHKEGYGVALLTSVGIDDATPGAFYAHVPQRGMFRQIGSQLARSGYEFAAGAGMRGALDKEGNDTGLMAELEEAFTVSYSLDDQANATASRLLLLSPNRDDLNEVGYTIDSVAGAFTLQGMFEAGLRQMERVSPDKFFMMMEAGNIDHANHGNDAGTSIIETVNFDNTLKLVYDFYEAHPDETLIIVTADHNTGGMSVGSRETGYSTNYGVFAGQRVSKDQFNAYCKGLLKSRMAYTWQDMEDYMAENLGYGTTWRPTDSQREELKEEFDEAFEKRNSATDRKTLYASYGEFVDEVFAMLNNAGGAGWIGWAHTGDVVPVFAVGAGAERFARVSDNTHLADIILELTGVGK